jgi:hypothetical protein
MRRNDSCGVNDAHVIAQRCEFCAFVVTPLGKDMIHGRETNIDPAHRCFFANDGVAPPDTDLPESRATLNSRVETFVANY